MALSLNNLLGMLWTERLLPDRERALQSLDCFHAESNPEIFGATLEQSKRDLKLINATKAMT